MANDLRLDLSDTDVIRMLNSPGGIVARDTLRRTKRVESRAKRLVRVDTGRLRSSITSELEHDAGGPVGYAGTNVHYAQAVHDGTGLYGPRRRLIVPRRARVLAWRGRGGKMVFSRSSRGSRPNRYLAEALPAALD